MERAGGGQAPAALCHERARSGFTKVRACGNLALHALANRFATTTGNARLRCLCKTRQWKRDGGGKCQPDSPRKHVSLHGLFAARLCGLAGKATRFVRTSET